MDNKLCILECGRIREPKRRYCRECFLQRKREQAKEHYEKFGRYTYTITCQFCGKVYEKGMRKEQKYCKKCWQERLQFIKKYDSTNYYESNLCGNVHRQIAENILKRELEYNEVVHHLDHNPINNDFDNIILLNRKDHFTLHNFLYDYEFKMYKQHGPKYNEFWNSNIEANVSLKFLEDNNIFYVRLKK